jgi:hypothetical protein
VRTRATRLHLAAWLSAASLVGVVPHVMEDATLGVPQRFGLSIEAAGWLFGLFVAAQVAAALGAMVGQRWALPAMVIIGVTWVVGALVDHPDAFQSGSFRTGLSSRLWIWAIVVLQSAVAFLAASVALSRRV